MIYIGTVLRFALFCCCFHAQFHFAVCGSPNFRKQHLIKTCRQQKQPMIFWFFFNQPSQAWQLYQVEQQQQHTISRFGLAVRRLAGKQRGLGSTPLRLSLLLKKVAVCGHCLVTLSLTVNETLKWLSSPLILMQESFWWWQCSDRYIISLFPTLSCDFVPHS